MVFISRAPDWGGSDPSKGNGKIRKGERRVKSFTKTKEKNTTGKKF